MKTKFLFASLLACLIFNICKAQPVTQWVLARSLISDDKSDTIQIYYYSTYRTPPIPPTRILIKSRTDTIREIQVENGSSQKLSDGSFSINIKKPLPDEINLTLIGHTNYTYPISKPVSDFGYFFLKNFQTDMKQQGAHSFTIDDMIHNGEIIGYPNRQMDSVFTIKKFQLSVEIHTRLHEDLKTNKILSPVFKGDSIPSAYSESLSKYFTGSMGASSMYIQIINVQVSGSNSLFCKDENIYTPNSFFVYKDSVNILLARCLPGTLALLDQNMARSDLRIRVEGYPLPADLETIKRIVDEINSLKLNVKAKFVRFFPSLVIQIDTSDTSFGRSRLTTQTERERLNQNIFQKPGSELITREMQREDVSLFFPKLSYASIFLSTGLNDQNARDIFLWRQITRSLTDFYPPAEYKNYLPSVTSKIAGFTRHDRLVLKTLFSDKIYDEFKILRGSKPIQIQGEVLLIVFVCFILFFIFYEINNYFSFTGIIKNTFLRNSFYALLIAQLFILIGLLINKEFYSWLLPWQLHLCGFCLVAFWLFIASDRILVKYFKISWQRLLFNPLLTLISLWIAYQFVYLFVRAEFLRFMTIDTNAKFIALSVVAVRFYVQYENEKITSLLKEKDYEVTRQKELKNRAELSTLQAKINPHFLYNALNSIAALAHIDSKRTEEMALSLSKLFRYNVNREEDMISTIRQEIEMVQLYLQIEKQRFGERLKFDISVDENLKELQVPRFLIQPIVENAIKHGISKLTGQGLIKIKIYEQAKNVFIEIFDNGPGFPQGLISGYGLQNTYDKLNLVYRKPYEIRFVNEPEKYIQIKL